MTSPTSSPSSSPDGRRFLGRTRLVTAASILAVVVAGAAAVSANVGILDTASDNSVGNASAAGDLTEPSSRVLDVYLPDEVSDDDAPLEQTYEVDVAGKVTVVSDAEGLSLGPVDPEDGWSWTLDQPDPTHLVVVMANGTRTFELHAARNEDGTITAKVTEPIDEDRAPAPAPVPPTWAAPAPTAAAPAPSGTSGTSGTSGGTATVDDHGGERDDAVEQAEDEAEHREDEAEDRTKEQEDGHDDDD